MAKYLDTYIVPVTKSRIKHYKKLARMAGKIFKEHGALDFAEYIADDLPESKTSFPRTVKMRPGEVVVVAIVFFKSRAHRDRVMKVAWKDPRLNQDPASMPYDVKRVVYGGFKQLVAL